MNTCATCKHWTDDEHKDGGICGNAIFYNDATARLNQPDEFRTKAEFGCKYHEPKEANNATSV